MVSPRSSWSALLLPGMSLNGTIFPDLGVPSAAADFSALVLSERGDLPAGVANPMDPYVERVESLVADFGPWRSGRRLVVGHSFGGMLALQWLASRDGGPGVDAMVLISTSPGPMYRAASLRAGGRASPRRVPIGPLMRFWNRPLVTRTMKRLTSRGSLAARPVDFRRLRRRSDLAVDLAGWRNTDWRAMRSFRLAMDGFDVRAHLRDLAIPAVVVHGAHDPLLPADEGRALADALPHATFRLVQGAGHALPLTHPEVVTSAVEELIARPTFPPR